MKTFHQVDAVERERQKVFEEVRELTKIEVTEALTMIDTAEDRLMQEVLTGGLIIVQT